MTLVQLRHLVALARERLVQPFGRGLLRHPVGAQPQHPRARGRARAGAVRPRRPPRRAHDLRRRGAGALARHPVRVRRAACLRAQGARRGARPPLPGHGFGPCGAADDAAAAAYGEAACGPAHGDRARRHRTAGAGPARRVLGRAGDRGARHRAGAGPEGGGAGRTARRLHGPAAGIRCCAGAARCASTICCATPSSPRRSATRSRARWSRSTGRRRIRRRA